MKRQSSSIQFFQNSTEHEQRQQRGTNNNNNNIYKSSGRIHNHLDYGPQKAPPPSVSSNMNNKQPTTPSKKSGISVLSTRSSSIGGGGITAATLHGSVGGGGTTNNATHRPSPIRSHSILRATTEAVLAQYSDAGEQLDRKYDFTPVYEDGATTTGGGSSSYFFPESSSSTHKRNPTIAIDPTEYNNYSTNKPRTPSSSRRGGMKKTCRTPSYTIDPFEFTPTSDEHRNEREESHSPIERSKHEKRESIVSSLADDDDYVIKSPISHSNTSNFIQSLDHHHPNNPIIEEEIIRLRLLAGKLSADWVGSIPISSSIVSRRGGGPGTAKDGSQYDMNEVYALERRIRDFQFAQDKRRKKYGDERPWGILGLYDHLSSIRIDVEWAEDAARRRINYEPYQSWAEFDDTKKGMNGHNTNKPYFIYCLLFLCSTIMLISIAVNEWTIEPIKENAMIGPSAETLIIMGAKDSNLIVNQKEGWRLLSSSVLHAGFVHFGINMLALWFVGSAIETTHGWLAAMIIFTLSAVGGSILSAIFLPEYITVGASGGIFGFIGACLADILMNWRLLFSEFVIEDGKKHRHVMVVIVLLLDIILNSIIGLTPYVDNYNHLGGMIYGFLCGLSTIERLSSDFFGLDNDALMTRARQMFIRSLGLLLTFMSILATLIVLLKGDGVSTPCPSCTWLSCVPFPPWESAHEKWWYCDDCNRVSADIIPEPTLHLQLYCPSGSSAIVDLQQEGTYDRFEIKQNLATYCRQHCNVFE